MKVRSITRNFWWKFASVAVSFGLWLIYSGARELTMSITAPVQYRNIPKDLEISSDFVEQVHLVLRGPSPLLSRLTGSQMPVILDLSAIRGPGQTTFTIDRRNVALAAGVILERAAPSQIRLRMDERLNKQVPVVVRFENVPDGFQVGLVELTPDRLMIAGPKSKVSQIVQLEADPVNLAGAKGQVERRTTAFSGSPQVTFRMSPSVAVRVTLQPK
jgi:YbbR domain-containing protein